MKSEPKVVFDTNIYISAVIFGGNPRACLELARSKELDLYVSPPILVELSSKLRLKFGWNDDEVFDLVEGIIRFCKVIKPKHKVSVIKSDVSDNMILECAKEAKADFIVSGDIKHVLSLKEFEGTKILNAKQFLDSFYE